MADMRLARFSGFDMRVGVFGCLERPMAQEIVGFAVIDAEYGITKPVSHHVPLLHLVGVVFIPRGYPSRTDALVACGEGFSRHIGADHLYRDSVRLPRRRTAR
jgi:hypothetical protein